MNNQIIVNFDTSPVDEESLAHWCAEVLVPMLSTIKP